MVSGTHLRFAREPLGPLPTATAPQVLAAPHTAPSGPKPARPPGAPYPPSPPVPPAISPRRAAPPPRRYTGKHNKLPPAKPAAFGGQHNNRAKNLRNKTIAARTARNYSAAAREATAAEAEARQGATAAVREAALARQEALKRQSRVKPTGAPGTVEELRKYSPRGAGRERAPRGGRYTHGAVPLAPTPRLPEAPKRRQMCELYAQKREDPWGKFYLHQADEAGAQAKEKALKLKNVQQQQKVALEKQMFEVASNRDARQFEVVEFAAAQKREVEDGDAKEKAIADSRRAQQTGLREVYAVDVKRKRLRNVSAIERKHSEERKDSAAVRRELTRDEHAAVERRRAAKARLSDLQADNARNMEARAEARRQELAQDKVTMKEYARRLDLQEQARGAEFAKVKAKLAKIQNSMGSDQQNQVDRSRQDDEARIARAQEAVQARENSAEGRKKAKYSNALKAQLSSLEKQLVDQQKRRDDGSSYDAKMANALLAKDRSEVDAEAAKKQRKKELQLENRRYIEKQMADNKARRIAASLETLNKVEAALNRKKMERAGLAQEVGRVLAS